MAFDGFVLNAVITELNTYLIGGKIQKIYQPNSDEVILSIYSNNLTYALSLNTSSNFYSAYLTTSKKENPLVAPNFCMLLRKHLMNYKITGISTINHERILVISLSDGDNEYKPEAKKLIVELMGKHSNILLLDANNIIIDSLKHFYIENGAYRNIFPHVQYILPASNKVNISDYKNLENKLSNFNSLCDFFVENFTGISKTLVINAINFLDINDALTLNNYNVLAKYILEVQNEITKNNTEAITFENDYTLQICESSKAPLQVNLFLDDYYSNKKMQEQFLSYRNQLLQLISAKLKRISKKLSGIDEKLKECQNLDKYKLYGELITNFLYQIPKEHLSHIELTNYYNNNELIDIPLDISILPADNAKKYFKKYHKLKNTFSIVGEQKIELEKEIDYLESIVYEIQASKNINDLDEIYDEIQDSFSSKQKQNSKKQVKKKNKKGTLIEPIVYEIDGFKVLVGKNNKQNDELTFKIANKDDIWFHVKDIHGSHVILVTNNLVSSQETINKCASIAAYHSKAIQSSNAQVDYTLVKYVKKPKSAKHGMVIYTNQKTVIVKPNKDF